MDFLAKRIRIVADIVHGDPPEWVRRAWKGCVLPCEPECGHIPVVSTGIVDSKPWPGTPIAGFSVPQTEALEILGAHNPAAAYWFRSLGYPKEGQAFRFKMEECEIVDHTKIGEGSSITRYDDIEKGTMRPV